MTDGITSPADWGLEYLRWHGLYEGLARRLGWLLRDLLEERGIAVVQVESRAKSVDSFVEKLNRKRTQYAAPLTQVTDLIGVRVVTYYREDVAVVGELIEQNFMVDEANSVDKTTTLAPSEFGYTGVHFVVGLGRTRELLPEWTQFRGKRAEIQVRTVAQHAWSAVDHKLNYKSSYAVPDELVRTFARLSALFETADEQFSQLRQQHRALESGYSASVRAGNLELEVNEASLDAYMSTTAKLAPVVAVASRLGWAIRASGRDPDRDGADRRDLAQILDAAGLCTIEDVDRAIDELDVIERELARLAPHIVAEGFDLNNSVEDVLAMYVVRRDRLPDKIVRSIWSDGFARVLLDRGAPG